MHLLLFIGFIYLEYQNRIAKNSFNNYVYESNCDFWFTNNDTRNQLSPLLTQSYLSKAKNKKKMQHIKSIIQFENKKRMDMSITTITKTDLSNYEDNKLRTQNGITEMYNKVSLEDKCKKENKIKVENIIQDIDNKNELKNNRQEDIKIKDDISDKDNKISLENERQIINLFLNSTNSKSCNLSEHCGLLHFRKWWERLEVDISVNGKIITGIPIFIENNTLRVINQKHSYFIPLEKVDYIRTNDGLDTCFDSTDITHKLFQ